VLVNYRAAVKAPATASRRSAISSLSAEEILAGHDRAVFVCGIARNRTS